MKETVIQFGEGGFLRAFADYFFQKMSDQGLYDGKIVVVQPRPHGMCERLMAQGCKYNLYLRGISDGKIVNERTEIDVISRCVNPFEDFAAFLRLADQPEMRVIISNTTEAGIEFLGTESFGDRPAQSFPAKLTQLLFRRFQNGLPGFILLPCELIDNNGEALRDCVLKYVDYWKLGEDFKNWILNENDFCSTLVDRIAPGYPREEADRMREEIGWNDLMIDTAEPFHLWAISGDHEDELPFVKAGFSVVWTDNIAFYKKRKVRILNGSHTAMVPGAYLYGKRTVLECMQDMNILHYLGHILHNEILPVIGNTEDNKNFAIAVIDRFANPFIKHMLTSIQLNAVSKFDVRVLPTILEYKEKFGKYPEGLCMSFAAMIAYYHTDEAQDAPEVLDYMRLATVEEILKWDIWHTDISELTPIVRRYYDIITQEGMQAAYEEVFKNS
ncbi:MAG: tagaturonate reductase [Lachnospiraceae bacterium]|nr:tagaturonate reductase [Lachnospiraceae bacterium]